MANLILRSSNGLMDRRYRTFMPFARMRDFYNDSSVTSSFSPAFEVRQGEQSYTVMADLPGVLEDDLDISIVKNHLSISGKREFQQENDNDEYCTCERGYGTFSRVFHLPDSVETDGVEASLKNGVLRIVVAKKPEAQPKKIELT